MHVHLPKPLHGWREFAGEVGIIVLGVLIALGAEQLISAIHQHSEARQARQIVIGEIEQNLDAFRRRAEIQSCIDRRLDELEQLIRAAPAPLPRPLWVGRPQVWELYFQRWTTAASGGRTSLLDKDEQFSLARFYSRFSTATQMMEMEQLAWARLRGLEVLSRLDPSAAKDMVAALEDARYANWRIKIVAIESRDLAKQAGYAPRDLGLPRGSPSVCVPLRTARADALKIIARERERLGFEP